MSSNNIISLIGMSNIGKSYWSKQLEQVGYKRFSIDDMIIEKASLSIDDVTGMAKWLGQPWSEGYADREKQYLAWENESVLEVLEQLSSFKEDDKIVIDTTGSMFYVEQTTIDRLVNSTKVVYLIAPEHIKQKMLQKYIDNPKPVIWYGLFTQKGSETRGQALARSYDELLNFRAKTYRKYSDIIIDYDHRFQPDYSVEDFLREINQ